MARKATARYEAPETDDQAYNAAMGDFGDANYGAPEGDYGNTHDGVPEVQVDSAADYPDDGVDRSEYLQTDDGFNEFRGQRPHEQVVAADTDDLITYLWYVMDSKKKLTEAFEERKRAMQRQIDSVEKALREQLANKKQAKKSMTFVDDSGQPVMVSIEPKHETHYKVADWEALYAWIANNSAYDVLQKRVSERTMKDYMDQLAALANSGEIEADQAVVPGVSQVTVPVLGVTTRKVTPKAK